VKQPTCHAQSLLDTKFKLLCPASGGFMEKAFLQEKQFDVFSFFEATTIKHVFSL